MTTTETEQTRMACPNCIEWDQLQTIERIYGYAPAEFFSDGEVDWEGHTEVDWDSSTTEGIYCKGCGWNGQQEALVPYPDEPEDEDA